MITSTAMAAQAATMRSCVATPVAASPKVAIKKAKSIALGIEPTNVAMT
jgi:hypothetical protein